MPFRISKNVEMRGSNYKAIIIAALLGTMLYEARYHLISINVALSMPAMPLLRHFGEAVSY